MAVSRLFPDRWVMAFLLIITGMVVWEDVDRFRDPVGEKAVFTMPPGAADFAVPFLGAKALIMGVSPYANDVPELADPYADRRDMRALIDGRTTTNFYPPSLLVLHIPFALATPDWREAGRLMFKLNVGVLFLLAVLSWWLLVRIGEWTGDRWAWSLMFVPLLFFLLSANGASSFALERGQSDIIGAALCWGALAALLTRRSLLASFLGTTALLVKGYALLLTAGLLVMLILLGHWRRALAGCALAVAIFVLPVVDYLSDGTRLAAMRSEVFRPYWYNHSFANVFWNISPQLTNPGRWGMLVISGFISLICWWRFRQAFVEDTPGRSALWGVVFATCSLATMIGGTNTSLPYNLLYCLPGLVVLLIMIRAFIEACRVPARAGHSLALSALASGILVFAFGPLTGTLTLPGIGLVLFVLAIGTSLLAGTHHRVPAAENESSA